jgi:hypothetical protein
MDDDTLHGGSGLFPELGAIEPVLPRWEVTFRVRCRDGGEPLKPLGVPSGGRAIACWTAAEGVAVRSWMRPMKWRRGPRGRWRARGGQSCRA